jgi:flagellar hook-basal body complex protein FliE
MAIESIGRIPSQLPEVRGPAPSVRPGAASFGDMLGQAIGQVESLQQAGDAQAAAAANGQGNLHELAMSLEKADIGMRVASKVRNKLVEAYQEVMRMPV